MTTLADRIIQVARAEVGVREEPMGSNTGKRVMEYQATTSLAATQKTGWAWCDAFRRWVEKQAGVPDEDNLGSASTAVTCQLARARGWLSPYPKLGAAIIWCGKHVGTVVGMDAAAAGAAAAGRQQGMVFTVEGNSGDAVTPHTRAVVGAMFVVNPDLGDVLEAPRLYWIDDPGAKYVIRGPWKKEKSADKTLAGLSDPLRRRAVKRHTGDGKWVLRIGDPPRRGPFLDPAQRDDRLARLEKTLGRRLVPRSTASQLPPGTTTLPAPSGSPEGLGKTT